MAKNSKSASMSVEAPFHKLRDELAESWPGCAADLRRQLSQLTGDKPARGGGAGKKAERPEGRAAIPQQEGSEPGVVRPRCAAALDEEMKGTKLKKENFRIKALKLSSQFNEEPVLRRAPAFSFFQRCLFRLRSGAFPFRKTGIHFKGPSPGQAFGGDMREASASRASARTPRRCRACADTSKQERGERQQRRDGEHRLRHIGPMQARRLCRKTAVEPGVGGPLSRTAHSRHCSSDTGTQITLSIHGLWTMRCSFRVPIFPLLGVAESSRGRAGSAPRSRRPRAGQELVLPRRPRRPRR